MNNLEKIRTIFSIEEKSKKPKYKQIVNSVINGINTGTLKIGDQLPSLNDLSFEFLLSKDTIQRAYIELRDRGIIESIPGRGFFIKAKYENAPLRILLVFNKLTAYKKIIYNAFVNTMNVQAIIDLHIHNYDPLRFEKIIKANLGWYDYFVIMPFFFDYDEQIQESFKLIPKEKLVLLNKDVSFIKAPYPAIYEDFEMDVQNVLSNVLDDIMKYERFILVFPLDPMSNIEIRDGFEQFCKTHDLSYDIMLGTSHAEPSLNELYLIIDDDDLAEFIKMCWSEKLEIGTNIGIISYNETILKEVLAEGITVMSTDFKYMGKRAAEMILNREKVKIQNPFRMIRRKSF